jgi:hypothetical protein
MLRQGEILISFASSGGNPDKLVSSGGNPDKLVSSGENPDKLCFIRGKS